MKTAMQKLMDIIEMEHNNGVEISHRVLWKMLNEAKDEEKQQIIDAQNYSQRGVHGEIYYNMVYGDTTNKETLK